MIEDADVDIFYLPLSDQGYDKDLDSALALLDDYELGRYQRFKVEHAKKTFLQSRRIAKTVLSEYLNINPEQIIFKYTDTGKPYLVDELNLEKLSFNISHSTSAIVVAVSQKNVGIDTEEIERVSAPWKDAEAFLNSHVQDQVNSCRSELEAAEMFSTHWTCMEAYVKLKGSAIYMDKDAVEVDFVSSFIEGKNYRFQNTYFRCFDFNPKVKISLAFEKNIPSVNVYQWGTLIDESNTEVSKVVMAPYLAFADE